MINSARQHFENNTKQWAILHGLPQVICEYADTKTSPTSVWKIPYIKFWLKLQCIHSCNTSTMWNSFGYQYKLNLYWIHIFFMCDTNDPVFYVQWCKSISVSVAPENCSTWGYPAELTGDQSPNTIINCTFSLTSKHKNKPIDWCTKKVNWNEHIFYTKQSSNETQNHNVILVPYTANNIDITQPPHVALNPIQPASVWNTHQCSA